MTPLHLDVHVPAAIAAQLRARGVDVLTSQDDSSTEIANPDPLACRYRPRRKHAPPETSRVPIVPIRRRQYPAQQEYFPSLQTCWRLYVMIPLKEIQPLADTIASEFRPEKIILFGSHARGQGGPDSDVDLLVLMPYVGHPARKAAEIINRTHPGTFSLDVIVRTPGEFLERQKMRDSFMRDIAREGKVLYAA